MAPKGRYHRRSTKTISKGYYPIGMHSKKTKLNKTVKELNQTLDNLQQKVNKSE